MDVSTSIVSILLILFFSISSAVFGGPEGGGPDGLDGLSERDRTVLEKKGILLFSKPDSIEAAVIFETDRDTTWNIISVTEDQWKYIKELKEVRVRDRTAGQSFETHVIRFLSFRAEYDIVIDFDPRKYTLLWRLDPSKASDAVSHMEGYWRLYTYGPDRTLGRYGSSVLLSTVPEVLQQLFRKGGVRRSLLSVKKYIEAPPE